jgi:Flp pilus assembly protein TadD
MRLAIFRILCLAMLATVGVDAGRAAIAREAEVKAAPLPVPTVETQEKYLAAARRMQAGGDFSGAMTFYGRVLNMEPNNPEAIYGTAEAMVGMGQALDSTKYYRQFSQLRPNDPRGPVGMARAFNRANRPADAIAALDGSAKVAGSSLLAFQERGVALDLSGRSKEAQTVYADALRLSPKNLDILRRLALSFALTEDYPTALSLLQNVANEPGGAATIRQGVAMIYALSGQADAAVKISATSESETAAKQRLAFFRALPLLNPQQRARAVHLNEIAPEYINQQLAGIAATPSVPQNDPAVEPVVPSPKPVVLAPAATAAAPPKPQMVAMPQAEGTEPDVMLGDQAQPSAATAAVVRAAPLPAADRFWVQLAASPNRTKLLQEWTKAAAKSNGGLNGYAPYLVADMIEYKPILRLVVGGFFDGSTAMAMVGRLKGLGIVSILKRVALPADPLFP